MCHLILGDTKGILTMFIRKKKYPSGNIGVIVVEKIGGKMKELATIGVAYSEDEVENLVNEAKNSIMEKQTRYSELLSQIEVFANADDNAISVLANCAAVMKMIFPEEYFWVGFYIVEGCELILGPFQGTPACTRIKFGRGVCGTAWKEQRTLVVEDVEMFPGHIACSSLSQSEIVVPLIYNGEVVGEIDIDSTELATFDNVDRAFLERVAEIIAPFMAKLAM